MTNWTEFYLTDSGIIVKTIEVLIPRLQNGDKVEIDDVTYRVSNVDVAIDGDTVTTSYEVYLVAE